MTTREIDQKIANGCAHRWVSIWWRPENWLNRRGASSGDVDPKVAVALEGLDRKKFYEAGYRRAYRCRLNCGLAYLAKTGAVVACRDEGV
jgi:hypothetical protein